MIDTPQFFRSLGHAIRGIAVTFREEQSFRLQSIAAVGAVALALALRVPTTHLLVILIMVAAVLALEVVNGALERIIDHARPRLHPVVRDVKDMMAAAVLIVSAVSVLVGVAVFWPYLESLL